MGAEVMSAIVVEIPLPLVVPGKLALMALPQDKASIAAAAAWRPDLVLTLIPDAEITAKGFADAMRAVRELSANWRHAPIIDYGVPASEFETDWPSLSAEMHHHLEASNRVLLHCHGGIGRSGLIAARLLVDLGQPAATAMAIVRSVRPGALETIGQEQNLADYAARGVKTRPA